MRSVLLMLFLSSTALAASPIQSSLLTKLQHENANVVINFDSISGVLTEINSQKFESREARINAVYKSLNFHAEKSQSSVSAELSRLHVHFRSLWISNQIYIPRADLATILKIAELPGVLNIREEAVGQIIDGVIESDESEEKSAERQSAPLMEWGIENVEAKPAWEEGITGRCVRVGIIDTGIRATHEALKYKIANGYHWYYPSNTSSPIVDTNGHGTHCTGTILGGTKENIIDVVAPDAVWMSCVGCPTGSCPEYDLNSCAQFMVCPHDPQGEYPNCDQAPQIMSNSWGGGRETSWFDPAIEAWRSAGIIPIFAQGNSGSSYSTANSPGDSLSVIGVGAIAEGNSMASFSSRGPSGVDRNVIKPDVAAPGQKVRSAWNYYNEHYGMISGTSMACPHTAGVVALILHKYNKATFDIILESLRAETNRDVNPTNQNCAGVEDDYYPNNNVGYGRISAIKSIRHLESLMENI